MINLLLQETLYGRKKGILFNKLNYRKYGKKKLEKPNAIDVVEQTSDVINQNVVDQFASMTIQEELANLLFFKTCLIDKDKEILKIKLKQTITLRQKVLKKRETKFIESFPFYFLSPDLVSRLDISVISNLLFEYFSFELDFI